MARLDEVVGKVMPDDLIVDTDPPANVVTVTLAATAGLVKRGAVITGTPGGKDFVLLTAPAETQAGDGEQESTTTDAETEKALYVVADDANTKADSETGVETPVSVYRTGHFAREKVNEATGYTLSALDEEHLRKSGILLSALLDY